MVRETLKRAGNYEGNIDDLIIGCAMPEAEQGNNMARNIGALAGLPIRFLPSQSTVSVLQDYRQLLMQPRELCLVIPIQQSLAVQNQ